jgi:DNA-binding FadR family transcriptional regulator
VDALPTGDIVPSSAGYPDNVAFVSEQQRRSAQDVIDTIGREIVLGRRYRPGDELTIENLEGDQQISRAMAREVLQALHAVRLVDLRPRVGASVRALRDWNVLHPAVIEWRLASASSDRLWRSLTQLRAAVEPAAARLAATVAPPDVCRDLVALAYEMKQLGDTRPFAGPVQERYRQVDGQFHTAVLAGSGNEMFTCLTEPVIKVLDHRIDQHFPRPGRPRRPARRLTARDFPDRPEPVALWLHVFLAQAIEQGLARPAEFLSRAIVAETLGELRANLDLRQGISESLDELACTEAEREGFRADLAQALDGETAAALLGDPPAPTVLRDPPASADRRQPPASADRRQPPAFADRRQPSAERPALPTERMAPDDRTMAP